MKTVKNIMETVRLYDRYVIEDNREYSYKSDKLAELRKEYMNNAIAHNIPINMLSKLSHMEHCHFYATNDRSRMQMRPDLYAELLEEKYPELLEWYADYMDHEGNPEMATQFRNLLKDVTQNVAA